MSKIILYLNTDADTVNVEMMTFRSSRLQMFLKIDVLEALLKKLAGWRQATLLKKRLQQRCFLVKFPKILRTPFLQNASCGCFCTSGGYICTFLKKWLSSYFAALLWPTIFSFSTYRLIYKKSNSFVVNFVREYPIKLKIGMLDHINNTFWNTVFIYLLMGL